MVLQIVPSGQQPKPTAVHTLVTTALALTALPTRSTTVVAAALPALWTTVGAAVQVIAAVDGRLRRRGRRAVARTQCYRIYGQTHPAT
jgi:hypothetical protein